MKKLKPAFLLHAPDAVKKGHKKLCVRTVDTDNVVVIAIAMFNHINPDELWLAFGTGKISRYIPVHEVKLLNRLRYGHDTSTNLFGALRPLI